MYTRTFEEIYIQPEWVHSFIHLQSKFDPGVGLGGSGAYPENIGCKG